MTPRTGARLLGLSVVICLLRLPSLLTTRAIDDENIYGVVGVELAHGGLPYVSAIERKPPLLLYLYAAVQRCFGDYNFVALHAVAAAWTLATMAGLYLAGKVLFDRAAGMAGALLYGLYLPFNVYRNLAWNGEMLMNLPLAFALAIVFAPSAHRIRWQLVAAGGLVATAALLKQPAAIALAPLLGYVLLPSYRRARGIGAAHALLHAVWLGLGFGLPLALGGLWLARLGILNEALFWSIGHHDVPHGPLDPVFWERGGKGSVAFAAACAPLCVGSWLTLRRRPLRPETWALLGLLVVSAVGTAASGRFYPHYYIQLLPPLVLLAGPWLAELYVQRRQGRQRQFRIVATWLTGTALAFFVSHAVGYWQSRSESSVARYIRAHAAGGDRMFVWGQAPELYVDCQLRPASRYVATFPLTGYVFASPMSHDPSIDTSDRIVPGSWERLAEDLSAQPPAFIVDADGARPTPRYPIRNYPLLRSLLDEHYALAFRGGEGVVYARAH
ncbi:MAG: glycosyltransferase family 39 protein [Polyangiales bacterium]